MSIKLIKEGNVKFPIICECSGCLRKWEVSELSDFSKTRGGAVGRDMDDYPMAYISCLVCGKKAFPSNPDMNEVLYNMIEEAEKLGGMNKSGINIIKGTCLDHPFKLSCPNGQCHAVIEVSTLDGIKYDDTLEQYYISCPLCGRSVHVYNKKVASEIFRKLLSLSYSSEEAGDEED